MIWYSARALSQNASMVFSLIKPWREKGSRPKAFNTRFFFRLHLRARPVVCRSSGIWAMPFLM